MAAAAIVVQQFIEAINAHDVAVLMARMTDDHRLVDAEGVVIVGRAAAGEAWRAAFAWMPDFTILIEHLLHGGDVVGLFGTARGTCVVDGRLLPENRWRLAVAWKAVVRQGKVAEWHVYCDPRLVYTIIERNHER